MVGHIPDDEFEPLFGRLGEERSSDIRTGELRVGVIIFQKPLFHIVEPDAVDSEVSSVSSVGAVRTVLTLTSRNITHTLKTSLFGIAGSNAWPSLTFVTK